MISWRLVAPELAKDHTVVVTDLRGYGDSSKPPDGENHANYSKRAMALDQVEVMRQLGLREVRVIGHDRGGRVGHRMALDHPDRVTRLAVLDIVPTYYLYTHVTLSSCRRISTGSTTCARRPRPRISSKKTSSGRRAA